MITMRLKIKHFVCFIFLIGFISLIILNLRLWDDTSVKKFHPVKFSHTIVHIDLKGAPPKISYLKYFLEELKKHNVTAILMEYEDMFPFYGNLSIIKASNAYSAHELRQFLEKAAEYKIEIIPLVQTFGHLQYVLKHDQFPFREDPNYDDTICPSRKQSLELIQEILQQVIVFHSQIEPLKMVHIGCDEVYHLNVCPVCEKRKLSSWEIFSKHIKTVSTYVKKFDKNMRVLIWDDMMRAVHPNYLEVSNIQNYIEPVVWVYGDILKIITHRTWYVYSKTFDKLWIASAFKGADGPTALIPNLTTRYKNHMSWLTFISTYIPHGKTSLNIEGIMITGWSRYDHHQPLCEVLPVAIPSLILNIVLVKTFYENIYIEKDMELFHHIVADIWLENINCPREVKQKVKSVKGLNNKFESTASMLEPCTFPTSKLYNAMYKLSEIEKLLKNTQSTFRAKDISLYIETEGIYVQNFTKIHKDISTNLLKYFDAKVSKDILQQLMRTIKSL